jgi:hypothetical protein
MNNTILAMIIVTVFVIGIAPGAPEARFGMFVVWASMISAVLLVRKIFRQNKWIF